MLVSIFTPTYNRAYIISKLYESLLSQTDLSFEWIVVDDGSTDNTLELLAKFKKENKINMSYITTDNGGKHRAINMGVSIASGDLFFIVDSDDYLTDDAVSNIVRQWNYIRDVESVAGLCFRRLYYNTGKFIGGECSFGDGEYTSKEIAYKLKINGDKAEVFKTKILKAFPFPEFENENFVPEALVWYRISKNFKLRFVNVGIYMCEYLTDGLSHNFQNNLKKNARGFALFYREVFWADNIPFLVRIKSLIRYLQCSFFIYKCKHEFISCN